MVPSLYILFIKNIPGENFDEENEKEVNEEVKEIMENRGVDEDTAEKIKELMDDEGLDEDEAAELAEEL